jgi:hypothetical protein
MVGVCDFDCAAPGLCGIPLFEVKVDHSIFPAIPREFSKTKDAYAS